MRKENKRDIWDVLELLQKRDPDWENPKLAIKFRILYFAWAAKELRHGLHTYQYYSVVWKRNGWHMAIGLGSSITQCSKFHFFSKTEHRYLVASFFCCTFAPDFKKQL